MPHQRLTICLPFLLALPLLGEDPDPLATIRLHTAQGDAAFRDQDFQEARSIYQKALALTQKLSPEARKANAKEILEARYKEAAATSRLEKLRIGDISFPETYDPITAQKPVEQRLGQLMFHPLVSLDERGEQWVGVLAKTWKATVDRLNYTFELRTDLRWPNGEPVTARDVESTIRILKNPDTQNYDPFLASFFKSTTVHDPFRITIHLSRQFFEPLSLISFKILPAYAFGFPLRLRDVISECQVIEPGKSFRLVLRQDLRWPTGNPIKVIDLMHTFERRRLHRERGEHLGGKFEVAEALPQPEGSLHLVLENQLDDVGPLMKLTVVPQYVLDYPLTLRDLAEEITEAGRNKTRIKIRKGVRWPSGVPVNADGVARSLIADRAARQGKTSNEMFLRNCVAEDGEALVLTTAAELEASHRLFEVPLSQLARAPDPGLPRGHWFQQTPLGSGPFFRDPTGDRGESERYFSRNPSYHLAASPPEPAYLGHRPFLAGVSLKIYHDRSAARQALEVERARETSVDVSVELRPLDIEFFTNLPENYFLCQFKLWKVHFLAFNFRRPLFQKKDVRQALCNGSNRAAVLEKIFRGGRGGQPHVLLTGPYPRGSWAYNTLTEDYRYDPKGARELLAKAGVGQPTFSLKFPSYDRNIERSCTNFQETLEEIGFEVKLERKLERDLHDEVVNKHDFDVAYMTYTFDETLNLAPLLDSSRTGKGGTNYLGYRSDLLMERFRELNARPNADRIQAIARDIHRHCHEDVVFCMLWQLDLWSAFRKEVKREQVSIHRFLFFNRVQEWTVR